MSEHPQNDRPAVVGFPDDDEDWPPAWGDSRYPGPGFPFNEEGDAYFEAGALEKSLPVTRADLKDLADAITTAGVHGAVPVRGRPPSEDRLRAEGAASFRLDQLGGVERQVELERELLDWCGAVGLDLSERTIRGIASEAIRAYRARLARSPSR